MNIPTGTVTLLFTDIEGSTRRWENQPDAMGRALEQHNVILQMSIKAHSGYVFYTGGDAFGAAFASPSDALAAALACQRKLQSETWPAELGDLRVRMALHTGEPETRDGDYLGPPVNRVARLLAAGHGGQILLSLATQEIVRDKLADGVSLLELGQHRLKDLFRPETIFQVMAPGLWSEFPALVTLDTQRTNLPSQATPFIGRQRELAALTDLLRRDDVRLVTLTGPGGIGKTRLSLQVAADLIDEFEDGAFFVELAPITDSDKVLTAIASTLGVNESGDESLLDTLTRSLYKKHLLLVIDNFEHVIAAAPVAGDLIATTPNLKVITSSRELLRVYGEHEYPVPPLGLPDDTKQQTVAVVSQYEAVKLFIHRATAAQSDFEITEENAPAIAEICTRLEGLPLAIELAAARVRLFEPEELLARLANSLKTLTGGARNLPRRQQTIRNAIEWSYDLLDANEQVLFARLSVFQGGRSIEAAEAVCGPGLDLDVLDGLESLLNKSLLRREKGPGGDVRFVMLETIYAYAGEQLAASNEEENLRQRHANYFADLAQRANITLTGGAEKNWVNRLTADYENLSKALEWTLGGGDVATGLRLVDALGGYWRVKSMLQEGKRWVWLALDVAGDKSEHMQSRLYSSAAFFAYSLHDGAECRRLYRAALEIEQRLGNQSEVARMLISLGATSDAIEDTDLESTKKGLALAREIGDKDMIAFGLNILGEIYRMLDDYPAALQAYQECLPLTRETGNQMREGMILANLGIVAFNMDNFEEARMHTKEAYQLSLEVDNKYVILDGLTLNGGILANLGQPERGIRLMGAGEAQLAAHGSSRQPGDQHEIDKLVALARQQVDGATFDRLWVEGEALSLEEAIELNLQD